MRDIWLVVKHDIGRTLRQRSFWFVTLLVPILLLGLNASQIIEGQQRARTEAETAGLEAVSSGFADLPAIGLVDKAGLIDEMPSGFPPDLFLRFQDESSARAALDDGEVGQVVHLPADYVSTGEITVYARNYQILRSGSDMGVGFGSRYEWILPYVINYNLTGDEQLMSVLQNPVPSGLAEAHALRPPATDQTEKQELAELVSTVMPYIYYFLLVMGSSYLMQSVVHEKENRTAEVLLLSLDPRRLLVGKMLAMSVVMWLQVVVWVGGGMLILDRAAGAMSLARFTFPPGFLVWALLFLVLGYLLFASVMAAAGALAPNAREGGQVVWLLVLPLMPTLMFGSTFSRDPNGTLAVVLSLFPLSAPSAMVTRLAVAQVPMWQILVSLAGLGLTAYLFIAAAGRFFRAGNLLSHDSFNWRRLATGWRRTA
jgi:ABC-2 type transport system permease protein